MDFDRLYRRARLEKRRKDIALWEAFKRAMNALIAGEKEHLDYDVWLDMRARWENHRAGIDQLFEDMLNER